MERTEVPLEKILKLVPPHEVRGEKDRVVSFLTADSREVVPGTFFVAKRGATFDGFDFIPQAVQKGATVIATERYHPEFPQVTQLIYPAIADVEVLLVQSFYGHPDLFLVGITGTNGKTTTAYLVHHLLEQCGLMGTIETKVGSRAVSSNLTTPDLFTTYRSLSEMKAAGSLSCVMEVSSHALSQGRVAGLEFDVGVFTNLSEEHLDYHKTMPSYAEAKAKLFDRSKVAVINGDSFYANFMAKSAEVMRYGLSLGCDLRASNLDLQATSSVFDVSYCGTVVRIETNLIGEYNVYNVLAAIGVGLVRGLCLEEMQRRLKENVSVPGRLERVINAKGPEVVVDFAHTQDALKNVMENLQRIKKGRLIVVFGCGGNRDASKRPQMGAVVEQMADVAIVTSDNPRNEEPLSIIKEILAGMQAPEKALSIADRKEAITSAISLAAPEDLVLIAGRGHEKEQLVCGQKVPFDDRLVAQDVLNQLGF